MNTVAQKKTELPKPGSASLSPSPSVPSVFGLFAVFAVLGGAAMLSWMAWNYYFDTPWTRDGSVRVYTAQIAPQISGQVTDVLVRDNQAVKKGDVLFKIDARDYLLALQHAQAAVDRARAQMINSTIEAARRNELDDDAVSIESRQTFDSKADIARAAYAAALVDLDNAKLNMQRVDVRSPVNGYVSDLLLQTGTYGTMGEAAMTLIDSDSYWIAGYFEETQVRKIHVGDPAQVILMGYPGEPIEGHVESLAYGIMDPNAAPGVAGLPSVNPVFTWVRLAQRIPVRIIIDHISPDIHLAAGMTATIHIGRPAAVSSASPTVDRSPSRSGR